MREGTLMDCAIIWMRLPIRWKMRIAMYNPPRQFRDEQIQGPYVKWVHTHRFWSEDQGTVIFDEVLYRLPFGSLGVLGHRLLVRRQLAEIFAFRQRVIPELLLGDQSVKARQMEPVTIHRQA